MQGVIRKISVGMNYPDGCLHYQVGSRQVLKRRTYKIVLIDKNEELLKLGREAYDIFIQEESNIPGEVMPVLHWKQISNVPVVIENNIDFE